MMPFNLLTAAEDTAQQNDLMPLILGACAIALLIAFCIGFAKGFRRVSWGGLVWIAACATFFAVTAEYGSYLMQAINIKMTTAEQEVYNLSSIVLFILAFLCILAVLIVYGILSLLFRGKKRKIKKVKDKRHRDAFGDYYDDDDDYDFEEDERYEKVIEREKGTSLISRFLGGITALVNVLTIVFVILMVAVLLINSTTLRESFASLYEMPIGANGELLMPTLVDIAGRYGMDMLIIGLMILIACKGRKKGLLESLRTLFMKVGNVVVILLALYLPFSEMIAGENADVNNPLYQLVKYFVDMMNASMGSALAQIAPLVGMLVAGIVMAVIASIAMGIVNVLWRKLNFTLRKSKFLRRIDGSLSCFVYLIIGAMIALFVWAILCGLDVFGILNADLLFVEEAQLSAGLHYVCKVFVEPFLEGISLIKG